MYKTQMCYSPAREPSMLLFSSKWVKLLRSWPSADPSPITLPPAPTMGPSLCHMWVWLVSSGRDCVRSGPLPFSRLLPVLGKAPGIQQDPAECQTLWETSWPCLPVLAECCVLLLFLQHLDWPFDETLILWPVFQQAMSSSRSTLQLKAYPYWLTLGCVWGGEFLHF